MILRGVLALILLAGPAVVIAYVLRTRYRGPLLRTFPFLKDNVFNAVLIVWLFIANFTYLPAVMRFWIHP